MVDREGVGVLNAPAPRRLRIATRESRLALWQARHVAALLSDLIPGCVVELVGMTTTGDQILDRPLAAIGGKGLFTKELESALLDGRADLAVHSLKDVPMELPDGFSLVSILERENPCDALVSPHHASLAALPQGATLGTSSLRRAAQLQALRPDLRISALRGNLDTRLRKLDEGHYDAIVLACAGLSRLGLAERIRQAIPPEQCIPSPGQGALGLEILADRTDLIPWLIRLEHPATRLATEAERAVSRALGGSCRIPLAAWGRWADGVLELDALLATDAGRIARARHTGPAADVAACRMAGEQIAASLAQMLA